MNSGWKPFRYRLEYVGLICTARVITLLPRSAVVMLARIGGAIAPVLDRAGNQVALANLEAAFGRKYSRAQRKRIVRESYQHFAQTMLDLMWSPRLTPKNFAKYVEVDLFPEVPDGGSIIACFHYSNFEWFSLASGYAGYGGTIIAQEFKNPLLDPVFRRWREQSGHSFTARRGGILRLFKGLRRGGKTAMLVDLTVPAGRSAVAIRCFGLWKSVTAAHAWLHRRSGAAIVPAHCEPLPRGRYRVVFHNPIIAKASMSDREVVQACWDSFEPVVRANPAPWLWMYKHWRQRPVEGGEKYPFYADSHKRFDRMLSQP